MSRPIPALFFLTCVVGHCAAGPDAAASRQAPTGPAPTGEAPKPTPAELGQWVMGYYHEPEPDAVPDRVRQMSELKLLKTGRPEANQMFFGKVMAANPDRIAAWMEGWKDLPEADREVLQRAVWMSQCKEGTAWLKEHGHAELAAQAAHPLLTGSPMVLEPYHVDMLWEWFFATGDAAPVKQIVGKYNLLRDDPGSEDLPEQPAAGLDRASTLRQVIGRVAVWSSASLASSQDRLLEVLKETGSDPKLPARSAGWLKRVIEIAERSRDAKPGE
jgi:hypothetical protein